MSEKPKETVQLGSGEWAERSGYERFRLERGRSPHTLGELKEFLGKTGAKRSEKPPLKTRARVEDPVRQIAGGYVVCSWVGLLLAVVGGVVRWEGLASYAFLGACVAAICAELARIAGRVGPAGAGDVTTSVLDAETADHRAFFRQRVALISIMATAQDPEARIRAKRELHWMDVELLGKVDAFSE